MKILRLVKDSVLELKKPHPCGSKQFLVKRVGSISRIVCQGCGRDMDIDRIKLEKSVKRVVFTPEEANPENN